MKGKTKTAPKPKGKAMMPEMMKQSGTAPMAPMSSMRKRLPKQGSRGK